jgi:hypothetical protein
MAKTKLFAVSLANQPGAAAEVARTLGNAKVNILALLGSAQGSAGTMQFVADDPRRAKKALDNAKIVCAATTAVDLELPNKPGALAAALDKLAAKGVNLNSVCATASKGGKKAVVVYTVEAAAKVATASA